MGVELVFSSLWHWHRRICATLPPAALHIPAARADVESSFSLALVVVFCPYGRLAGYSMFSISSAVDLACHLAYTRRSPIVWSCLGLQGKPIQGKTNEQARSHHGRECGRLLTSVGSGHTKRFSRSRRRNRNPFSRDNPQGRRWRVIESREESAFSSAEKSARSGPALVAWRSQKRARL